MDWITPKIERPFESFIPLGTLYNNQYFISDECFTCLTEMNAKINCEDPATRPLRRTLIFLDVLHKDLIPILVHIKKQPNIVRLTVELLVWMTVPIKCLIPEQHETSIRSSSASKFMVYEFTQFLCHAKEAFLDLNVIRAVLDHLNNCLLLEMPLKKDDCEFVHYLLLLIRNILHVPERSTLNISENDVENTNGPVDPSNCGSKPDCPQQRQILGALFAQGFGQILISLLSCSQKPTIGTPLKLVDPKDGECIYKDHQAEDIQKLLPDTWVKTTAHTSSELSEDDESNTSHYFDRSSSDRKSDTVLSSSSITSAPNGNSCRNEMKTLSKEKWNLTSRETNRTNWAELKVHNPSTEDITRILTEFTTDFMLNGFNTLVHQLHEKWLQRDQLLMAEKSYFLWLLSYFLRFASHLKLGAKYLKDIFVVDFLSSLTWDAIYETEVFEIFSLQPSAANLKSRLRRLLLGVTALREYLQALHTYLGSSIRTGEHRLHVEGYLPIMHLLRQLFFLRLRLFNSVFQSRRYLCDIITANHVLLITLERTIQNSPNDENSFDISKHLEQFCTKTILNRYGTALADFKTNSIFINDCIFTVLHHVGIDLGRPDLLSDLIILEPFSQMWTCEFNLCNDWEDLVYHIVQQFIHEYQCDKDAIGRSHSSRGSSELQERENYSKQATFKDDELSSTDVELLMSHLIDCGYQKQLNWIQTSLLAMCSARLSAYSDTECQNSAVMACLSLKMNVPCPLIPWTEVEASALLSKPFKLLLHRIGLLQFDPQTALFPRIPLEWSVETIYSVALLFGPVEQKQVNFSLNRVTKVELPISNLPIHGPNSLYSQEDDCLNNKSDYYYYFKILDSDSTTSSLEVQKTSSTDEEEC